MLPGNPESLCRRTNNDKGGSEKVINMPQIQSISEQYQKASSVAELSRTFGFDLDTKLFMPILSSSAQREHLASMHSQLADIQAPFSVLQILAVR